ncbi:MAG: helix-turn-helix domain-containing protein [Bacteroidia bacterium]|nr:helix-turn-helix domain-containing protein [Bacteroidia bacterium]
MLLSARIKGIRINKKLSQADVSNRLQIEQSTYSGYENEAGNLKFNTVVKIAEALDCSIPFLTDITSSIMNETEWRASFNKL